MMQEVLQLRLTRAALDRLIGEDKEIELILTHAAVQQVLRDHLDSVREIAEQAIKQAVADAYGSVQRCWDSGQYKDRFVISTNLATALNAQIKLLVDTDVHNYLVQNRHELSTIVASVIDKKTSDMIEFEAKRAVQAIIKKASDAIVSK